MGEFEPLIQKLSDDRLNGLAAEDMGVLNLNEVVDLLRLVRGELEAGESLAPGEITTNVRNEILSESFANQIDSLIAGMEQYGATTDNPQAQREQFRATAEGLRNQVIERLRPIIRTDEAKVQQTLAEVQQALDGLAATQAESMKQQSRVSDRLRDGDPESVSQALTTCRRLIDSCADHLFAPRDDPYEIAEDNSLVVGKPNVLNRLQAYCHETGAPKSRKDRLRRTLADLYDRCSAGTHADVSVGEARFVFLQTYVALGEILTLGALAVEDEAAT